MAFTAPLSTPPHQPYSAPVAGNPQSYTDLSAMIASYMNRTDLGPVTPSFVALAEARIALDLRTWQMVKRLIETAAPEDGWVSVPDDWLEWDRVASNGYLLDYMPRNDFWAAYQYGNGAQSYNYTMEGDRLIVAAPADASTPGYQVDATYYARIPALAGAGNWLLEQYPNIYLYGSLVSACEYVKDEQRAGFWAAQYKAAVDSLNSQSYKAALSGSQWRQRPR